MTLNVHLINDYTPETIDYLRSKMDPVIHLTTGNTTDPGREYQILIDGRPSREMLSAHAGLRTLIIPWTGLPPETRALLADFPQISVHNIHHNTIPVAEMAIALLLAAAKNIIPFDNAMRQGDWTLRYQRPAPSLLLDGKTVLISGYGAIGRRTARICHAMGMHILATKRNPESARNDPFVHQIHPPEHLHALLPQANAVVIALPLTPETEGLFGNYEFSLLPPASVLVNVGRGAIVKERALYQALKNGVLGAAGLDVWYNYPVDEESRSHTPPSQYPLWDLGNVVMSPHRAALTEEIDLLRMDHLSMLLNAAAENLRIPNAIDLQAGY